MPLTVNVGLSRKASANYNSAGLSINLTAELDPSLLGRPDELQAEIGRLYAQAEAALERQARRVHQAADLRPDAEPSAPACSNGHTGNGRSSPGEAPITASQQHAITRIAAQAGADADAEARQLFGAEVSCLSRPQASRLIDELKGFSLRRRQS